jgi:histidyl-tRNA synthetase
MTSPPSVKALQSVQMNGLERFLIASVFATIWPMKKTPDDKSNDTPKKLSTESYKGVRDFFPADMAIEKKIFDIWRGVCEKYGYEEYGASVLEPAELYRAKSGEEIVNEQTYTFIDRGEREVTLRPEMTPTVARMVAAKRRELAFPLRWYSIPNLFRYENPQRGRLREHWQLNVDIFGVEGIEADVEIISVAGKIMQEFKANRKDFTIIINYAGLLIKVLKDELDFDVETSTKLLKVQDKFNGKIPPSEVQNELEKAIGHEKTAKFEHWFKKINSSDVFSRYEEFKKLTKIQSILEKDFEIYTNLFLTRGFDYYTGVIFEIFDINKVNRRSLFGGGHYDNLTSLFGGEKVPAVGFGMGDVTMRDFLETHNLLGKLQIPASADYYICVVSPAESAAATKIAEALRAKGSRVAVDFTYKKIGDQIKNADKRGIPEIIVVGEDEAKTGTYKIKNLKTGEERAAQ